MYKAPKNPKVEELTKSHKERIYRLSDLSVDKSENGRKRCVWCLKELQGFKLKWCSSICVQSALIWADPCGNHSLRLLLYKNNFKCSKCETNYRDYFVRAYNKIKRYPHFRYPKMKSFRVEYLVRWFRRLVPRDIRPEVDHIEQVSMGGTTLGLSNVQLLCSKCHKIKTNSDLKIRLEKKGNPRKGVVFTDKHKEALSNSRKGKDSLRRIKSRKENLYPKLMKSIVATNLDTGEILEFDSISLAAKTLNLQAFNISRVLNGKQGRKKHKGWTFRLK